MAFETIIGLEVHSQLNTDSKIFCGCSTSVDSKPNTNICPVCTGNPGVLPVLNKKVVEYVVKTGIALNSKINKRSVFARKQYFYPDLPKNYQISQYELPVIEHGSIDIHVNNEKKKIGITRIHLEEDAGKLLHAIGSRELDYSLVDLNRTGVPLMEIVSEPDMRTPEDAYQYLAALKSIIEYLGVSECNMEEGKFRCDANVSIRPVGQKEFGTKAELKNMNSLSGVRDALAYEIQRQTEEINSGKKIIQETRLWDPDAKVTRAMRTKEEAHDYRYFPDPDLVPIILDDEYINEIKKSLPELPLVRRQRLINELGLSDYDSEVITSEKALADYYEQAVNETKEKCDISKTAKPIANWLTTELLGRLNANKKTIKESPVLPKDLGKLIVLIQDGTISGKIAKTVFDEMFKTSKAPDAIVKEKGLVQISDESAVIKICEEAILENPKAVEEYKAGKERAIGAIVGAVMKKSKGQANPQVVNKILVKLLN
ncbi:Asp-tRNA(Asn)/Glu-tRNA(Gln) amidotransferase subunit GatB [Elusimicrobiota bacterium]